MNVIALQRNDLTYLQLGVSDICGKDCANRRMRAYLANRLESFEMYINSSFYGLFHISGGLFIQMFTDFSLVCQNMLQRSWFTRDEEQSKGTLGREVCGVYGEVLVSDEFLQVDCSKAVQLLLNRIVATWHKWWIGRQIVQILSRKIDYVYIFTLKSSNNYFLCKSFIWSFYIFIRFDQKDITPSVHMNKIQTRLLYISISKFLPRFCSVFFYKSQLYKFCTQTTK